MAVKEMTAKEILKRLESMGSAQTTKIYRRHGAEGDMYGVKVGDLKGLLKEVKGNAELIEQLWQTNNSDAMYLAGLAADGKSMPKKQLDAWAKSAWWYMLSEYAVPFAAGEHPDAPKLAMKWIKSKQENVASSGWATYAAVISTWSDDDLDLAEIKQLLQLVKDSIQNEKRGRVRYCMNGFVICVGCYVAPLLKDAKAVAKSIGSVEVEMGETACKVPNAVDTVAKVEKMGRVGKKRKTVKC